MKAVLILLALVFAAPTVSFAGNCAHASDRASDGSICGGRASDQRDGGD